MDILLTGNTSFKIANFRAGLIRKLKSEGHGVIVLAPYDAYTARLTDMECRTVELKMDRNGVSILSEIRLFFKILFKIRRINPKIVFSYTIKNNLYAGISCRILGINFYPNVTGLGPAFNKNNYFSLLIKFLYKFSFRDAKIVFFQNEYDRSVFIESRLVNIERTNILPGSGVDLKKFKMHAMPSEEGGIVFIFSGRLLWDKGIGILVEAARKIKIEFPMSRFKIMGPLDLDSKSAISLHEINAWHQEGVIEYVGGVYDVIPEIVESHCVILPSFYREGTPRSLLEASALGRPIITTDMPGCRDVVVPGVNGFLCDPKNVDDLAHAIKNFLNLTRSDRCKMGIAARAHVEKFYDENIVINEYIKLIENY